jgi:mannosyltransferase
VPRGRERLILAALVAVAAALRFTRIGHQSFWLDESYTVDLVQRPFGHMLSGVASDESTPPLYYVLAWLWQKPFGHGEAGLRSLSAVFGTLTAPVAWRAAREWFDGSARAGLIAAALVAFNPFFVWYSQEARSYALLVLMAALTLLFVARRSYGWWALSAALAICTHYFALFLLVPEAIWLVWTSAERKRRAWIAAAVPAAVAVALIPLAVHQRDLGHTSFIAALSFRIRITDLPKKLVTGELGSPTPLIGPLAGLIVVAAVAYALVRFRRPAWSLIGIAAFAAVAPLVLALAGADYVLARNMIAVYLPVILVAAAGFAGRVGIAGAALVCAIALVVDVEVATDVKLQRDDWRSAAKALGQAPETRVVIVTPPYAKKPLRLYAGSLPPVPPQGIEVREVVAIMYGRPPKDPAPPPGFPQVVGRARTPSYSLVRFRSPVPRHFAGVALIQKGPTQ